MASLDVQFLTRSLVAAFAAWLGWYAWRFIFTPLMYPDEPRELPYLVPVIGHAKSMLTGAHHMFTTGRKYFGSTPWAITIMGETMYVIGSPEDVQAVYKAPKALDFDPFIMEMLQKYGLTKESVSKMFLQYNSDNKNWMDQSIDNFKLQMHPGEKLEILQKTLLDRIDETLTWDNLHGRMVREEGDNEKTVSLYDWGEIVIVDAQTRAFFDPSLYEVCPELLSQFQIYEDEAWKLPLDLPGFATKALNSTKAYIEQGLIEYMRLPMERRSKESWLIQNMIKEMDKLGLDEKQRALTVFSFYRVINANAFKLTFWIISHLLFDDSLLNSIKAEIEPAFQKDGHLDLNYLFESCPLLISTCEEVLRLTNWPIGTRTVMNESVVGGKRLRVGRKLLMPYRAMHFDPNVFGHDAENFSPTRFQHNKNLLRSTSYRPFGGAAHYCPGRFIARREVQMFVALMLKRFTLSLGSADKKKKVKFPKMDNTLPSGGIQSPSPGQDLIIRVRPA